MGPEVLAIITAVNGIIKLTTTIIAAIQRGGQDLPEEAKEAIREAGAAAQAATAALSKIPIPEELTDDD